MTSWKSSLIRTVDDRDHVMEFHKKIRLHFKMKPVTAILFVIMLSSKVSAAADDNPIEQKVESKVEKEHKVDSALILMLIGLLILTVLTVWLFKVKRFRYMHETGLSMIYGMIIGLIIKYVHSATKTNVLNLKAPQNLSTLPDTLMFSYKETKYQYKLKGSVSEGSGHANTDLEQMAVFDPEIFFYVLLPPIIFFAGYDMKKRFFFRNIGAILMYAFIGTSISCVVFGSMIYAFIKMVPARSMYDKFTFQKCLLFGSLISATDPGQFGCRSDTVEVLSREYLRIAVTILAVFHDLHVDVDLYALVFGESVMNDAVAIVLYRTIDEYKSSGFEAGPFFKAIGEFIGVFGGSFLIGFVMGLGTALLTKLTNIKQFPLLETALFFLMSYSTFLLAEIAQLTGIVAVLFCGISQAHYTFNNLSEESKVSTKQIFALLNFISENFIFVYMGLTVFTFNQPKWDAGFISWSFLALLLSRFLNIYPLSLILNFGRSKKISWNFQHMLLFAGLRGAVAFALAIRNTSSEPRQLMLTTVLMIVLVTVIFNGGITMRVLQFLNIRVGVDPEEELKQDFVWVRQSSIESVNSTNSDSHDASNIQEEIRYERSYLVRTWHRFDVKYMKPLFTTKGPPIQDVLPKWCSFLFICCPASTQRKEDDQTQDQQVIDMDDELLNLERQISSGDDIIRRPARIQRSTSGISGMSVEESADLGSRGVKLGAMV